MVVGYISPNRTGHKTKGSRATSDSTRSAEPEASEPWRYARPCPIYSHVSSDASPNHPILTRTSRGIRPCSLCHSRAAGPPCSAKDCPGQTLPVVGACRSCNFAASWGPHGAMRPPSAAHPEFRIFSTTCLRLSRRWLGREAICPCHAGRLQSAAVDDKPSRRSPHGSI